MLAGGAALALLAFGLFPDGASLSFIFRGSLLAIVGLTTLLVGAHATHGFALDVGARRAPAPPPPGQWRRALRFGLYAAGWDLVLGPVGFFVLLFREGPKAAFGILDVACRLPTRSSIAFFRGAYRVEEARAKPALTASYVGAAFATIACAMIIVAAVVYALCTHVRETEKFRAAAPRWQRAQPSNASSLTAQPPRVRARRHRVTNAAVFVRDQKNANACVAPKKVFRQRSRPPFLVDVRRCKSFVLTTRRALPAALPRRRGNRHGSRLDSGDARDAGMRPRLATRPLATGSRTPAGTRSPSRRSRRARADGPQPSRRSTRRHHKKTPASNEMRPLARRCSRTRWFSLARTVEVEKELPPRGRELVAVRQRRRSAVAVGADRLEREVVVEVAVGVWLPLAAPVFVRDALGRSVARLFGAPCSRTAGAGRRSASGRDGRVAEDDEPLYADVRREDGAVGERERLRDLRVDADRREVQLRRAGRCVRTPPPTATSGR